MCCYDSTEDLRMRVFRCLGVQASVVEVVKLNNEDQGLDTCLFGIIRCSYKTLTNIPMTGWYNVINT